MSVETEVKLRFDDFDALRRALGEAGATCAGCVVETNWFFDRPDGSLRAAGKGVRIRAVEAEDDSERPITLTYKGPSEPGPIRRRPEIELAVSDADTARDLLLATGFVEILVYQKRRETWLLAPCRIELDDVPELGCFVEIEGPDRHAVADVQQRLALDAALPVTPTYAAMMLDHVRAANVSPPHVMFQD